MKLTDKEILDIGHSLPQDRPLNLFDYARAIESAIIAKLAAGVSVEPAYLCESTRFKVSFFQNEDAEGGYVDGTHVTCFESFEDELDGRWVALVPAENDRHIADFKTAIAAARVQALEQAAKVCESEYDNWDNERPLRICATAIRALIKP